MQLQGFPTLWRQLPWAPRGSVSVGSTHSRWHSCDPRGHLTCLMSNSSWKVCICNNSFLSMKDGILKGSGRLAPEFQMAVVARHSRSGLEFLQGGSDWPLPEPVKVNSKLPWRLQYRSDTRTMGASTKETYRQRVGPALKKATGSRDGRSQVLWIPDDYFTSLRCWTWSSKIYCFLCWVSALIFLFRNRNVYALLLCIGTM